MVARDENVLQNRGEICALLEIGRKRFNRLRAAGLPVRFDGYSYVGDKEKVLAWWKDFTDNTNEKNN